MHPQTSWFTAELPSCRWSVSAEVYTQFSALYLETDVHQSNSFCKWLCVTSQVLFTLHLFSFLQVQIFYSSTILLLFIYFYKSFFFLQIQILSTHVQTWISHADLFLHIHRHWTSIFGIISEHFTLFTLRAQSLSFEHMQIQFYQQKKKKTGNKPKHILLNFRWTFTTLPSGNPELKSVSCGALCTPRSLVWPSGSVWVQDRLWNVHSPDVHLRTFSTYTQYDVFYLHHVKCVRGWNVLRLTDLVCLPGDELRLVTLLSAFFWTVLETVDAGNSSMVSAGVLLYIVAVRCGQNVQ